MFDLKKVKKNKKKNIRGFIDQPTSKNPDDHFTPQYCCFNFNPVYLYNLSVLFICTTSHYRLLSLYMLSLCLICFCVTFSLQDLFLI